MRTGRRLMVMMACGAVLSAGCGANRRVVSYPPDALIVAYEPATTYSTCLLAATAMAANYLEDRRRFTVPAMLAELRRAGADESRVGDVRRYLADKGLHLVALSGRLDDKPEEGLSFWLNAKGYPPICIINRTGDNPAFNHAVVVIGIQSRADSTETIHYLDPSADPPLFSCDRSAFETLWGRCGRAMLLVVRPPADANDRPPRPMSRPGAGGAGLSPNREPRDVSDEVI
ncbi:MAG: hypothetical protein AMXMBFR83_13930 [Phycisphaerae bacterium]